MSKSKSLEGEPEENHVKFSTDVGYFDKFLEALEPLHGEGILVFTDEAVYCKVADPANVAMCVSKLEGQSLNSLRVEGGDSIQAGVEFDELRNYLKGVSNNSELEVTWPVLVDGRRYMRINIIDEDLQFDTTCIDTDSIRDPPDTDMISPPVRIVMSGKELKQAIKHADKVIGSEGNGVKFITRGDRLIVRTQDKVNGRFSKTFHQSGPSDEGNLGENSTIVSMDYLGDIKNVIGRASELTFYMNDDYPVRLDIELDNAGDAKIKYVIAPRLED